MLLGIKGRKNYYLDQNPLTKELSIKVNDLSTGKVRIYRSKKMIQKIFCSIVR